MTIERPTRFEAEVVANNLLAQMQAVTVRGKRTIKRVAQDYQIRRLGYHGTVKADLQFAGELQFSDDDGYAFSQTLGQPAGNRLFQIRVRLSQLQGDPPIRGVKTQWVLPPGWAFADGLGTLLYDEFVSNPLVVARVMTSPTNPQPVGFRVIVLDSYR